MPRRLILRSLILRDGVLVREDVDRLSTDGGWSSVESLQSRQEAVHANSKTSRIVRVAGGVRLEPITPPVGEDYTVKVVTLEEYE